MELPSADEINSILYVSPSSVISIFNRSYELVTILSVNVSPSTVLVPSFNSEHSLPFSLLTKTYFIKTSLSLKKKYSSSSANPTPLYLSRNVCCSAESSPPSVGEVVSVFIIDMLPLITFETVADTKGAELVCSRWLSITIE